MSGVDKNGTAAVTSTAVIETEDARGTETGTETETGVATAVTEIEGATGTGTVIGLVLMTVEQQEDRALKVVVTVATTSLRPLTKKTNS